MSDANEEIVRRGFEALNRGDLEAGKELMAEDCELRTLFTAIAGRTYHGRAGVDEWWADVRESWQEVTQTPERFIHLDAERMIVATRFEGQGNRSGIDVEQMIYSIWEIRDGLVARIESFGTLAEAQEAAGLSA